MSNIKVLSDVFVSWDHITRDVVESSDVKQFAHHSHISLADHLSTMSRGSLEDFCKRLIQHDFSLKMFAETPIALGGKR